PGRVAGLGRPCPACSASPRAASPPSWTASSAPATSAAGPTPVTAAASWWRSPRSPPPATRKSSASSCARPATCWPPTATTSSWSSATSSPAPASSPPPTPTPSAAPRGPPQPANPRQPVRARSPAARAAAGRAPTRPAAPGARLASPRARPLVRGRVLLDDLAAGRAEDREMIEHRSRITRPIQGGELCAAAPAHAPPESLEPAGRQPEPGSAARPGAELGFFHLHAQRNGGPQPGKQPVGAMPDSCRVPGPRPPEGTPDVLLMAGDVDHCWPHPELGNRPLERRRERGPGPEDLRQVTPLVARYLGGCVLVRGRYGQHPGRRVFHVRDQMAHHVPDRPARARRHPGIQRGIIERAHQG